MNGQEMYKWAQDLFPICRSITGEGVRYTLNYFKEIIPCLAIKEIKSGTKVYDWVVPQEWKINEAYVSKTNGEKIIDFQKNNLHVVGYSEPVNKKISIEELQLHLHSLPSQPDVIPYVTSYYNRTWGFCVANSKREDLKDSEYKVFIDSELFDGVLNYGEVIIKGELEKEVFLSTYICHPSMANNELSGPIVAANLAKWLGEKKNRYTYRIVFVPETIGSIAYIHENFGVLKSNVFAGFNLTCLGDDRCYSYLPSRSGNTYSDEIAQHVLASIDPNFKKYKWSDRGSDERQYCSPGVDLPIASIMRSKYNEYPEYHTSLDNLELISPEGLYGGFIALKKAIEIIEKNYYPKANFLCEPQLGKRGLYPNISTKETKKEVGFVMNVISMCDSSKSVLMIADSLGEKFDRVYELCNKLADNGVLKKCY